MSEYPPRFFLPNTERIVEEARVRPAWGVERVLVATLFAAVLWGSLLALALARGGTYTALLATAAVVGALAHVGSSILYAWRRVATSEYVVTDASIYSRRGLLLLALSTTTLDRVTDLHVRTTLMGRLFGFSSLTIRTAGGGLAFIGVADAYRLRSAIQEARQSFVLRLLEEAGQAGPTPKAGRKAGTGPCQCPRCEHVFTVPTARPIEVRCPSCGENGMLFEEVLA